MFGDKSRENKEEIDRIIEVLDNEIKNNPTLIEIKKKWIVEKEILYDNTTAAIMATKISLQVIEKEGIDDLSADDLKNMMKHWNVLIFFPPLKKKIRQTRKCFIESTKLWWWWEEKKKPKHVMSLHLIPNQLITFQEIGQNTSMF